MKKEKRKAKNTHGTTQKEKNMYYRSNTSDIYLVQNARKRKINNSVATLSEYGGVSKWVYIENICKTERMLNGSIYAHFEKIIATLVSGIIHAVQKMNCIADPVFVYQIGHFP